MRERVGRYRRAPLDPSEDPVIGCVFVRDTRFFSPGAEADPPPGFALNIVQGKGYDLAHGAHARYFAELLDRLLGGHVDLDLAQPWQRDGPVYGDPRLAPLRLGESSKPAGSCRVQVLIKSTEEWS